MEKYVIPVIGQNEEYHKKVEKTLIKYTFGNKSAWESTSKDFIQPGAGAYFFNPHSKFLTWCSNNYTLSGLRDSYNPQEYPFVSLEEFIVLAENNFQKQKEYTLW